jgi:hypothetical protein
LKLLWIHLPGLTRARLSAAGDSVWSDLGPTHRAKLVPSFPWWPASILASMRCGCLPREHHVLETGDEPATAHPDQISALAEERTVHEIKLSRTEELRAAACDGESADLCVLTLSADLWLDESDLWPALLEILGHRRSEESRILLSGDCTRPAKAIELSPDSLPLEGELKLTHAEERVAWLHAPSPPSIEWRDRVLEIPGVERVLGGRGLELYGVPSADAAAVVLEPGHRFESPAGELRVEDDEATEAVLLGWGDPSAPAWTDAAHDYRIAATIRAGLGLTREGPRGPAGPLHLGKS